MAIHLKKLCWTLILCLFTARSVCAFSLLGPFAPWMGPHVGFVRDEAYDVGGPRNLGDEFRWNVPVVTYGFDEEFKEFFGTNGIAAVEGAIAILNALPPASQMDLSMAPASTKRIHSTAQSKGVFDFKSMALVFLLEQIGLANPVRFTWSVTSINAPVDSDEESGPHDFILRRNFDPFDYTPSSYVNGVRHTYKVAAFGAAYEAIFPQPNRIAIELEIDQGGVLPGGTVAAALPDLFSARLREGEYFATLTQDDRGGLKYLLHTNNVNLESTLPRVRSGSGDDNFVKVAARPGVDKITFQRLDPGGGPVTNVFEDVYFADGQRRTQMLQRVMDAPDILFTAANHPRQFGWPPPLVRRTGPNFSHQNETGSGILQPEVVISFHKLGDIYREPYHQREDWISDPRWSSFDSRTLTPSPIFPVGPKYQGGRTVSVRKVEVEGQAAIEWKLRLVQGVGYAIEASQNLVSWEVVTNITASAVHTLTNAAPTDGSAMFLRARRVSGH